MLDYDSSGPSETRDTNHPPERPVNIDVDTVYGLGLKMRRENNENLKPRLQSVRENFKMDENNWRSADYPAARGLASISPYAKSALDAQDMAMWSAGWVLQSHSDGSRAMGNIAMRLASEFSGTDELNGADTDRIREISGIEQPDPLNMHPHSTYGAQ